MFKSTDKVKITKNETAALVICLVFYAVLCFACGVELCADSRGYINMISAREPVYPLFLALFREVFGENIYLNIVIFIQNMLMAYAVWMSSVFIKRELKLKEYSVYLLIAMHFFVALLCQFVAGRGSVYPNSIMTEGIAMPLWIIFMVLVWKAVTRDEIKNLIAAAVLAAVMIDIRKQMAAVYLILFASCFLVWIGKKGFFKKMLILVGLLVASFIISVLGTQLYNYVLRGDAVRNTRDMNLVLTTSLYIADEDDERLISEEKVRELFRETYAILDEKQCIMKYAGDSWSELESHYEESFDMITVDTTKDLFVEYAIRCGAAEGTEAEQEADRMSGVIVSSLLADNFVDYLKVYFSSVANGLINSIAKRNSLLDIYSLLAYIVYICMMIVCLINEKTGRSGIIGMTVLLSVVINACSVSAFIFPQTRYVMYSMALFYDAVIFMAIDIYRNIIKKTEKQIEIG